MPVPHLERPGPGLAAGRSGYCADDWRGASQCPLLVRALETAHPKTTATFQLRECSPEWGRAAHCTDAAPLTECHPRRVWRATSPVQRLRDPPQISNEGHMNSSLRAPHSSKRASTLVRHIRPMIHMLRIRQQDTEGNMSHQPAWVAKRHMP